MPEPEPAGGEPMEALLDTDGAARLLGVSRRTVEAWVQKRRIPFIKLGAAGGRGLVRFRPEALRAWLLEQETPAAKQKGGDDA